MPSASTLCTLDHLRALRMLLADYGMRVQQVDERAEIPGSYWGEREAGLINGTLYVRRDTPLHSALHEACHFICMDDGRRASLHADAGGDIPEENAVCYLPALLADRIPGFNRYRLFADMDAWGYSFRLGSACAWFERDAGDGLEWLQAHDIIDTAQQPTGRLRR